jgi:hypothetical protein
VDGRRYKDGSQIFPTGQRDRVCRRWLQSITDILAEGNATKSEGGQVVFTPSNRIFSALFTHWISGEQYNAVFFAWE